MSDDDDLAVPDDAGGEAPAEELPDPEAEGRLWLRTIAPLLAIEAPDAEASDRVRWAFDRLRIAACEAAGRILRGVRAEP